MCVWAPAASSALRGSRSSTCSNPLSTRIATRKPFRSFIAVLLFIFVTLGGSFATSPEVPSEAGDSDQLLLLVILDSPGRTHLRLVRIFTRVAQSFALTQQIPAAIEFHLNHAKPFRVFIR